MPTYQIYDLGWAGYVERRPHVVSCASDDDAVFAARRQEGAGKEIWQDRRRVALLPANGQRCETALEVRTRMTAMILDVSRMVESTRATIDSSRECLRKADRTLNGR